MATSLAPEGIPLARIIAADDFGLEICGERIRAGKLVAFPTETVYGLGANALDASATLKIFEAKGRPANDPLIVHVSSLEDGLMLVDIDDETRTMYHQLATDFWPGPLTIVLKSRDCIPPSVTANTGFVGIRVPNHPIARRLLHESRCPIAAPSANRFSHVSPTRAKHVYSDLMYSDIVILDGGDSGERHDCEHGIESTVVKLLSEERKIVILRRGAVSSLQLSTSLAKSSNWSVHEQDRHTDSRDVRHEAPGQLITHYSPCKSTYLIRVTDGCMGDVAVFGPETIVVDFHGILMNLLGNDLISKCAGYRDLSPSGDCVQAGQVLFEVLRWTESVEGGNEVYIAEIALDCHELAPSVMDRIFRAASGRVLHVCHK